MKRVLKNAEPPTLTTFRNAVPNSTWDQMKDDTQYGGKQAYQDCRAQSIVDQGGLCAYCELDIRNNHPLQCRVEHFHPKSDTTTPHNWALDWQNMLGVCNGGDNPHLATADFHLEPTSENLSCDAHKNKIVQSGRLTASCEGWILTPLQLAVFPCLFHVEKSTGYLMPDTAACANHPPLSGNRHGSVAMLVQHTIDMLNLNCDRLAQARLRIIRDIEHNKKKQRQAGFSAQQGLANLAQRYFRIQWPAFFTTIRLCLGPAADAHLQAISFQG